MKFVREIASVSCAAAVFALMLMLVGCAAGSGSESALAPEEEPAPAALIEVVVDPRADETPELVIIHTNDIHGCLQADDTCLGLAAVAQMKADYESEGCEVLLFDAGDALQGSLLADDSKGETVVGFMNDAGYDAMALGNHEFDYGADLLEQRIDACDFPALCANVTVEATGEPFAQPNAVFDLSDGTKLGVFGLDTPETMTKADPRNTAGLFFAQGEDLYACAQDQIDELRAQGCDYVVCLSHLGEAEQSAPNRAIDVVEATTGLDLFIDGHDHGVEKTRIEDASGKEVLVVETGCYLANIGVVEFYEDGGVVETLVAVGEYEDADEEMAAAINTVADDIDARASEIIGETAFKLNGHSYPGVRDRETNLGDFVADALLWQAEHALGVAPDCAVVNGGSIQASIDAGDISLHDFIGVCPFANQVCLIEVSGAQLLEALEAACQDSPASMGSFPQVSGLVFNLDESIVYENGDQYPYSTYFAPANPGSRIEVVEVNGKPFHPEATYRVAVTDFMAFGGDTYYCLLKPTQKSIQSTGYSVVDAMRYYLVDECGGVLPDEYTEPQGRVTILGDRMVDRKGGHDLLDQKNL